MEIDISIKKDTATPGLARLNQRLSPKSVKRAVGGACVRLLASHLKGLGPNKRGWPSTGFYKTASLSAAWDETPDGVSITADNEDKPGSLRQRYHGGTIRMKDKLLAIPARAEFYGRSPSEFTNLRFAAFRGGSMALLVGGGGVGRVNFQTGREQNVKGAGARSEGVVAYWLKEEVNQQADPGVIPTQEQFAAAAQEGVDDLLGGKA